MTFPRQKKVGLKGKLVLFARGLASFTLCPLLGRLILAVWCPAGAVKVN